MDHDILNMFKEKNKTKSDINNESKNLKNA